MFVLTLRQVNQIKIHTWYLFSFWSSPPYLNSFRCLKERLKNKFKSVESLDSLQLKMIHMPKRHILGSCTLLPSSLKTKVNVREGAERSGKEDPGLGQWSTESNQAVFAIYEGRPKRNLKSSNVWLSLIPLHFDISENKRRQ